MNIISTFSKTIIILAIVGGVGYNLYRTPCDTILTYSIDRVDKEFGISKEDVITYSAEAAALFNASVGKDILKYDDKGTVKISLIYDERQRETIKANRIKAQIEEDRKDLNDIKMNIDEMKRIFEEKEEVYASRVASHKMRLQKYNTDVNYWNDRGGAPREEYSRLQTERNALENEEQEMQKDANDLQQLADMINKNVQSNNSIVENVNQKINEVNKNAGKEFEEGVYESLSRTITIYQYSDATDLKRVLAHELGHALGMDHVEGKTSIMYYLNTGKVFKLSTEDKTELDKVCSTPYLLMMIGRVM